MTPDFNTSVVFKANYTSTLKHVVNQGGTYSGKTYSILQVLFCKAVEKPNIRITVAGQDIPNLKAGALRDAQNICKDSLALKSFLKSYNATDRVFTFKNGSFIEFKSYSTEQDAKSGKRDYLFVNEANGIPYNIFWQLATRTEVQVFIDYNPSSGFWAHEKLIGSANCQLIISDHRHNPFLSRVKHDELEAIKAEDLEYWKVYARGMTGKVEGLVFRNWDIVDAVPEYAQIKGYGLDFGFTNDPTAYCGVWIADNSLYIKELLYETNLTNQDIAERIRPYNELYTVADSSEPKSIVELERAGIKVIGANKGADSVKNSIDILKRYKIHITRDSVNLRKEFMSYRWKTDKTGKAYNEPVDFNNHLIDALRYIALNNFNSDYGRYVISSI